MRYRNPLLIGSLGVAGTLAFAALIVHQRAPSDSSSLQSHTRTASQHSSQVISPPRSSSPPQPNLFWLDTLSSQEPSLDTAPRGQFSWTWENTGTGGSVFAAMLQSMDGSSSQRIFSLPFINGGNNVGNPVAQMNEATDSIVLSYQNCSGIDGSPHEAKWNFCTGLFQLGEEHEPRLLFSDGENTSISTWMVHPRLPLLFIIINRMLYIVDLSDHRTKASFDLASVPGQGGIDSIRISSDGTKIFSVSTHVDSQGSRKTSAALWWFDLANGTIGSTPFTYDAYDRLNFPVSLHLLDLNVVSPTLTSITYDFHVLNLSTQEERMIPENERYDTWNARAQWSSDGEWLLIEQHNTEYDNGLYKNYILSFNPTTNDGGGVPLEGRNLWFIPGTHTVLALNGETYNLDTRQKETSLLRPAWQIQWYW